MPARAVSLNRMAEDVFECHSVLSRRRWSTDAAGAANYAGASDGIRALITDGEDFNPDATRLFEQARAANLGAGAWYLASTFDYPFLDYAKDGYSEDRARMQRYAETSVQDGGTAPGRVAVRSKLEDAALVREGVPVELLELMTVVFAATHRGTARWHGTPLYRRTSPSGGGRHPTNGYLLVPGREFAIFLDPLTNELMESTLRVPVGLSAAHVLFTLSPGRNRQRYQEPRTFRTIFMDVGHIAHTLVAAAPSLGLKTWNGASLLDRRPGQGDWADQHAKDLAEFPVLTIGVGAEVPTDDLIGEDREIFRLGGTSSSVVDARPVGLLIDHGTQECVASTNESAQPARLEPSLVESLRPLDELGDLPEWVERGWGLAKDMLYSADGAAPYPRLPHGLENPGLDVIASRRTERAFSGVPIESSTLREVLGNDVVLHRDGSSPAPAPQMDLGVIVYNVAGLDAGVYRWARGQLHLTQEWEAADLRARVRAALQGQASTLTAAATICAIGDLQTYADHIGGPAALYDAWIESGVSLQGCILRAQKLGLAGLTTPAVAESAFASLFELDGPMTQILHTFTLGVPAGEAK